MDLSIAAILAQDGITTGAVYALLALALVLVFSVTRVILIPQGEFVSYGALTLAAVQTQHLPATCWLLLVLGAGCFLRDLAEAVRELRRGEGRAQARRLDLVLQPLLLSVGKYLVFPLAVFGLTRFMVSLPLPMVVQVALALLIVIPVGPMVYRLAFEPLAEADTLLLLIVAVAVHFVLVGVGLLMFGAEGVRTTAFTDASFDVAGVSISGQSLWVVGTSLVLIVGLYLFFDRSLSGKALRATAVNRRGARLMGISTVRAGRLSFTLAAAMGALSGILIVPLTTIYYDSGFLIGLKGFVGAIVGALASYPVAAAGALLVGLLESYSSFWASAYKEVIVFTLIIPVLLWRSFVHPHHDDEA
jgi:branched-chain amino acid transport system permease protein